MDRECRTENTTQHLRAIPKTWGQARKTATKENRGFKPEASVKPVESQNTPEGELGGGVERSATDQSLETGVKIISSTLSHLQQGLLAIIMQRCDRTLLTPPGVALTLNPVRTHCSSCAINNEPNFY